MNKIIVIFATLLFASGAYAAPAPKTCSVGSLKGDAYSYIVNGVNGLIVQGNPIAPHGTSVIGLVVFDGKSFVNFTGTGSAMGEQRVKTGSGRYEVTDQCIVRGYIDWVPSDDPNNRTNFTIVLDQLDTSEGKPYKAVHGVVLATAPDTESSAAGELSIRTFKSGQ